MAWLEEDARKLINAEPPATIRLISGVTNRRDTGYEAAYAYVRNI
jgi:hypothetical protein